MTDAEKQIREALAAETRPGDWRISKHRDGRNVLIYDADGFEVARVCYPNRDANAAFIIACHPAAISELLDELERLRQKLRGADAAERSINEALNSGDGNYRP